MARIRTIKPEFPQSETVGKLSRDARLCFILLWTVVDDEGRARAASRMLASLLYPYDDDAKSLIDGWLDELERENCIQRYSVDGAHYVVIVNWLKHQKIDKPSKSRLPPPPEASRGLAKPREPSATDLVSRTLDLGPSTLDLGSVSAAAEAGGNPPLEKPEQRTSEKSLWASVDPLEFARKFLRTIKHKTPDESAHSVALMVSVWSSRAYDPNWIIAIAAEVAAEKQKRPLSYFYKAIERRHDERARELVRENNLQITPNATAPPKGARPDQSKSGSGYAAISEVFDDFRQQKASRSGPAGDENANAVLFLPPRPVSRP